jgi:hypothetical protein
MQNPSSTATDIASLQARVDAIERLMEERKQADHRAIDLLRQTFPTQRDLAEWREDMNSKLSMLAGKSAGWAAAAALLLALAAIIVTVMKHG